MAMFIADAWHVIGYSDHFADGELVPTRLMGKAIVIARSGAEFIALEDRCSHRFAPLSKGRCEGPNIRCMYHGLLFNKDGQCVAIPGQDYIPERSAVRSYAVIERGGWVFIWGGAPAEADEALLPPFVPLDSPDHIFVKGFIDYDAANHLINANLLDFTHLAFVHTASFGADENWANACPTIKAIDRGVKVEWWVAQQALPDLGVEGLTHVDLHTTYEYLIPGILVMRTDPYPLGTIAALSKSGEPCCPPIISEAHGQAVTALTETTSRYFYTWGVPRTLPGAEEIAGQRLVMAQMAFAEDKAIIEAQQAVITGSDDGRAIMPIMADKAITLFERKMAQLAD